MTNEVFDSDEYWDNYEHYRDMGKKWKASLPRYSQKELLEIFPDAVEVFKDKVIELKDELKEEKAELERKYREKAKAKQSEQFLYELIVEFREYCIARLEREIKRFEFQISKANGTFSGSQFDIESIKQTPIPDIIGSPVRTTGNRALFKCPLHNEDTPSFTWYKDQNSWWCFGCSQGGSVIDLVMKINSCDFVQACKILSK